MKAPVAIVQSVHESAVREINALEQRIAASEDDADAKLWEQGKLVVRELDGGMSQVALARSWKNKDGESYSRRHVQVVEQIIRCYLDSTPRKRFRELDQEIQHPKAHVSQNRGNNDRGKLAAPSATTSASSDLPFEVFMEVGKLIFAMPGMDAGLAEVNVMPKRRRASA